MQAGLLSEPSFPTALPLRQRIIIFVLVIIAHGFLLSGQWVELPDFMAGTARELSVTIVHTPSSRSLLPSTTTHRPVTHSRRPEAVSIEEPEQVRQPAQQAVTESPPPTLVDTALSEMDNSPATNTPSGLSTLSGPSADREPDYRADYLDNPQPKYPMIARRKGWQGKVVLEVEVLADGSPGEIDVEQSSGRKVLDNAAMGAVQNWQFISASRAGLPITQRFLVPIVFNLK